MPFEKGYVPWNKDLDWKPRSAFKKGDRPSVATEFKKGMIPWNYKGGKPSCLDCGKSDLWYGSKRCKECAHKGERSNNWKGGITSESRLERVKFRRTMQKLIFERDGYKCQLCDATGNLQVDHIVSWSEFKELRFDPDNCRTLCAKCHYEITFKKPMPENIKTWGHNLERRISK